MLGEMTTVETDRSRTNVHAADDPELNLFPIAYLSEPGYWYPTESEALGLRQYLERGAFLIVDDFHFADEWEVFETAMKRVLPNARIDRLDIKHPIFDSFFHIKTLDVPYPGRLGERGLMGEFFGIHEDNDPTKRLMVIINYNGHWRLHRVVRGRHLREGVDERGIQVRDQLHRLRSDALTRAVSVNAGGVSQPRPPAPPAREIH
jgi:hypothetical protein